MRKQLVQGCFRAHLRLAARSLSQPLPASPSLFSLRLTSPATTSGLRSNVISSRGPLPDRVRGEEMHSTSFETATEAFYNEITKQSAVWDEICNTLALADPSTRIGLSDDWFEDMDQLCLVFDRQVHGPTYGTIRA